MEKATLSHAELFDIIREEANQLPDAFIPDDWEQKLADIIPENSNLKSFSAVNSKLCKPIAQNLGKNPDIKLEYGFFVEYLRNSVSTRISMALGLDQLVQQENKDGTVDRELLIDFLNNLDDGKEWTTNDFRYFSKETGNCYARQKRRGGFNLGTIKVFLGAQADILLAANPFKEPRIKLTSSEKAVCYYLLEFLSTIPEGSNWSPSDLVGDYDKSTTSYSHLWESSDGKCSGLQIVAWLRKNGGTTPENIERIFQKAGLNLPSSNQFELKRERVIHTPAIARNYLMEFLLSLPEGQSWSQSDLEGDRAQVDGKRIRENQWISADGKTTGINLLLYISNHFGVSEEGFTNLLGNYSYLLERNPYTLKLEHHLNSDNIGRYIAEFLNSIEESEWNTTTLCGNFIKGEGFPDQWISSDKKVSGTTLKDWLYRNGGFTNENIQTHLGEEAKIIESKPLVKKPIYSRGDISKYFAEFLESMPIGPWSWIDLRGSCKTEKKPWKSQDGYMSGDSIYNWLIRNDSLPPSEMKSLLGDRSSLLDKKILVNASHYEHQKEKVLAAVYLSIYLYSLSPGEKWSQSKLLQAQIADEVTGEDIITILHKNYNLDSSNSIDWEYVVFKLLPPRLIKRNPFTYKGSRLYSETESGTTSIRKVDISDYNNGTGLAGNIYETPENLLIAKEEDELKHLHMDSIRMAIDKLPPIYQEFLHTYLSGNEIESEDFQNLVLELQRFIFD